MSRKTTTRATRSSTRNSIIPKENEKNKNTAYTKRREVITISDSESENDDTIKAKSKTSIKNVKAITSENKTVSNSSPNKRNLISINENISPARRKRFGNRKQTNKESESDSEDKSVIMNKQELEVKSVPESPTKLNARKKKNLMNFEESSPPKQRRSNNENCFLSPSKLLERLNLNVSPEEDECTKAEPKMLLESSNPFQNARKALFSTQPVEMPGREKEHKELREFIKGHIDQKISGAMYISGPPGTGKTASLSIILKQPEIASEIKGVYVNCTSIKSSGSIYSRIVTELGLKASGKTEKDYVKAIETHLGKNHKMILLVLDEIDQLESKKQSVLYTIFEWPSKPNTRLILIGIANALDLTDRTLPRLQARCELQPELMHFASYTKQQIIDIFISRLKAAGVLDLFSPPAIQMLAGKVASVSGDIRRALDIGRRVIELVERSKKQEVLKAITNYEPEKDKVEVNHVVGVLNSVYGTTTNFESDRDGAFPLQQKIVICTLVLMLKKARNKDVTIGRLHDVYRKVCEKRNLMILDHGEFAGLCSLIETKGIIKLAKKKEVRLRKVTLEWDEEEVCSALRDKQLMSTILQDDSVLGKM